MIKILFLEQSFNLHGNVSDDHCSIILKYKFHSNKYHLDDQSYQNSACLIVGAQEMNKWMNGEN